MLIPSRKVPIHTWVAASAWGSRLVTAVTMLLSIPLLIRYLGAEEYSLFVVAMSLQGWWLLADLGIAISLQNFISERRSQKHGYADLMVNSAAVMVLVALGFGGLLFLFYKELALAILPVVPSMAEHGPALVLVTGLFFLVLTIGNVAYRVLYAEHRGYLANILPALGSVAGLLGLMLLEHQEVENHLLAATIAWNGPSAFLACIAFVSLTAKALKSPVGKINLDIVTQLLRRGRQFLIFAVMSALTLQIDYIVIGKIMSAHEVLLYNVSTKMLGFVSFLYLAIIQSLWPVCTEAFARKEWDRADSLFQRAMLAGIAIVLFGSGVLWCFKSHFVELLAPHQGLDITFPYWALLTMYALIRVWSDGYAMLLQSMSQMKVFMYYLPIQAIISAAGQLTFGLMWGLNGILLGLIASFLLTSVWLLPLEYRKARASQQSVASRTIQ
jgi:O-antigen/teichoic acid export membrane protein